MDVARKFTPAQGKTRTMPTTSPNRHKLSELPTIFQQNLVRFFDFLGFGAK